MEDSSPVDQYSASERSSSRHLRYPLRSGSKVKEDTPHIADSSSAPRRGRFVSNVSKSISVVDISGKEKSAKPPRRQSIPSKSASKTIGTVTPVSSSKTMKNETPMTNRKKFNVLSSTSYWLSQIKLSESAAKHSISLGFFELAFVARCEPLERMKDELKSYAQKHNLAEYGESVKELFDKYKIVENFEQLKVSETCSHVPEEKTRSSDEDEADQVKLKSSNSDAVAESNKVDEAEQEKLKASDIGDAESKQVEETTQESDSVQKIKRCGSKSKVTPDKKGNNSQKKPQKSNQGLNKSRRDKMKKLAIKPVTEEGPVDSLPVEKTLQENKENVDIVDVDEINSSQV